MYYSAPLNDMATSSSLFGSTNPPRYPGIGRLFSLGGLSECGKSFAGQYFAAHGVARVKIARVLERVGRELGLDPAEASFTDAVYLAPTSLPRFLELVAEEMASLGAVRAVLESMYRPQMADFLSRELGERMVHIYIEAPLELRVHREWLKLRAVPQAEVRARIAQKDAMKRRLGVPELRGRAFNSHLTLGALTTLEELLCSPLVRAHFPALAAAAGIALGVPLEECAAGLAAAALSPWRMEVHEGPGGVVVVNDAYNASPASVASALETCAGMVQAAAGEHPARRGEGGGEVHDRRVELRFVDLLDEVLVLLAALHVPSFGCRGEGGRAPLHWVYWCS